MTIAAATPKGSVLDSFKTLAVAMKGFPGHVIAFDPGETTGWAWFHDFELIECGQIPTGETLLAYRSITNLIARIMVEIGHNQKTVNGELPLGDQLHIAIEDYRIYSWKADDHKWAQIHTIKVVAIVELVALLLKLPHRLRMAQHAKNFFTDDRLKAWGMWKTGQRHARDAIRHGCLYIVNKTGSEPFKLNG